MRRTSALVRLLFALLLLAVTVYSGCSASHGGRSYAPSPSYAAADSAPAPSEARAPAKDSVAGPADGPRRADVERRHAAPAPPPRQSNAGLLTSGEWRDLDHWGFWQELTGDSQSSYGQMTAQWRYYTQGMIPVVVQNDNLPIADVSVSLEDEEGRIHWTARTDNRGRAYLFHSPFQPPQRSNAPVYRPTAHQQHNAHVIKPAELFLRVRGQNQAVKIQNHTALQKPVKLHAPLPATQFNRVADVMFVVDTTGSMGDELNYLKNELKDVIQRARKASGDRLTIRTSVNFYRDHRDAYLVRSNPFHTNINQVMSEIDRESAGGGGDFPEAVDEALEDAIVNHTWSRDAAARILFLILDAPPHNKRDDIERLHEVTVQAAKRGIRIVPVVASGINKPTEMLMRSLAITTGGTYTFITDHSGIGNSHLKPTVGPHQIEQLNTMLARIIYESSRRFDDPQLQWSMR